MSVQSPSLSSLSASQPLTQGVQEKDWENSTLLKMAVCIPVIGLVVGQVIDKYLNEKIDMNPLPKIYRPKGIRGKILDKEAPLETQKAACLRHAQLLSIQRDYSGAYLVNNVLTIALTVYAVALNVIHFALGAFMIGPFSLTAAVFVFGLYNYSQSIKRYQNMDGLHA
ncbi:MAG: hypothetical protein ACHQUC_07345 [Chlamydiales bacterium]